MKKQQYSFHFFRGV